VCDALHSKFFCWFCPQGPLCIVSKIVHFCLTSGFACMFTWLSFPTHPPGPCLFFYTYSSNSTCAQARNTAGPEPGSTPAAFPSRCQTWTFGTPSPSGQPNRRTWCRPRRSHPAQEEERKNADNGGRSLPPPWVRFAERVKTNGNVMAMDNGRRAERECRLGVRVREGHEWGRGTRTHTEGTAR
jgi:hypothetical protein